MKKLVLSAAVLLAAMCACQKEAPQQEAPQKESTREYAVSITATKGIDTKALALNGKSITATWEGNDAVAVCVKEGTIVGKLTPTTIGESTTLLIGTITMDDIAEGTELYLQYPYKAVPDGDRLWPDASYSGQDGTLDTIAEEFDYATCGVKVESIDDNGIHTSKAAFYNRQAIIQFKLMTESGRALEVKKLFVAAYSGCLSGGFFYDNYFTTPSLEIIPTEATNVITVALHNDYTDYTSYLTDSYTLVAVTSGGIYTKSTPFVLIDDGKYYTANVHMSELSYSGYGEYSPWSVIGELSEYDVTWDNDLNMWSDGTNHHVAAHVKLAAGDEFKLRKNQEWQENRGGTLSSAPDACPVYQDGANLIVKDNGIFDIYYFEEAELLLLIDAYNPYPMYTSESEWSIIGDLPSYVICWDGDLQMLTNGSSHAFFSLKLTSTDSFKFRLNRSWDYDLGGTFDSLGTEFAVEQGGPNISVGIDGVYDVFLDPEIKAAYIIQAKGLKQSKLVNEPSTPDPQPVVNGWGVIGVNGDWANDIMATESPAGVWTVYFNVTEKSEFKWRKDGGWDENYGINPDVAFVHGTPSTAVAGGRNIPISSGIYYKAVLDLNNYTITVSEATVWGLIGQFNSWSADVDMTLVDGKWVSPATQITSVDIGFKIRKNHSWDYADRGGDFSVFGVPFQVIQGGNNIVLPADGTYIVTYDPSAETITVVQAE
ncbi:MAG: hypothetical protein J5533_05070 [Bacteroidales bacterium]|nr:hypothetical protein [Bacteroidales bacterium]